METPIIIKKAELYDQLLIKIYDYLNKGYKKWQLAILLWVRPDEISRILNGKIDLRYEKIEKYFNKL